MNFFRRLMVFLGFNRAIGADLEIARDKPIRVRAPRWTFRELSGMRQGYKDYHPVRCSFCGNGGHRRQYAHRRAIQTRRLHRKMAEV